MKRAQAALEFLTTYGWAFLIIIVMIASLSYFGVIEPSRFLPDKCLFGTGIGTCFEYTIIGNSIMFKLTNNMGGTLSKIYPLGTNGTNVEITGVTTPCAPPTLTYGEADGEVKAFPIIRWNTSQLLIFNITCPSIAVGERPSVTVSLGYETLGKTYAKTVEGTISVRKTQ